LDARRKGKVFPEVNRIFDHYKSEAKSKTEEKAQPITAPTLDLGEEEVKDE
jgi:hypothetical protein